jgi:hypothetical protein
MARLESLRLNSRRRSVSPPDRAERAANDAGTDALSSSIATGDADESLVADRIIVVLLIVLRAGTLVLAVAQTVGSSSFLHPPAVTVALLVLAGQSGVTFGLASWRLHRRINPVLGDRTALVETVAGVAALGLVAYATPPALRTTSSFWIEPYTVISVLVLAAASRRAILGTIGTVCLTVTYLLCVLIFFEGGAKLSATARAAAWTNALSYLPFFAIVAVACALVRSTVTQTEALRRLLGRLSAERARVAAATSAYRIGHDIPKALLREVRRGTMGAEQLRPWAVKYRDDLVAAVRGDASPLVHLDDELIALASAFASAVNLRVDLGPLGDLPPGTPALLIVEAARELLNNASYHAYGYPATLTAGCWAGRVQVTVHNDGPGIDPRALTSAWARKQNTLHQLEAAGGSYQIVSSATSLAGTTVTLTWPATLAGAGGKSAPCAE